MFQELAFLSLATAAFASFAGNLNYRSPSHHHPSLGVSIRKVAARNTPTAPWDPAQLNFTHGVASGDPYDTSVILWTRAAPTSVSVGASFGLAVARGPDISSLSLLAAGFRTCLCGQLEVKTYSANHDCNRKMTNRTLPSQVLCHFLATRPTNMC
jgi:hypothetical protein